jgi:hypothetical protein
MPFAVADMETVVLLKTLLVATSNSGPIEIKTSLRHHDACGDRICGGGIAAREVNGDRTGTRLALKEGRGGDCVRSNDRSLKSPDLFRPNDTDHTPIGRTEKFRVRSARRTLQ